MDVRVKLGREDLAQESIQEILTGLPDGSLRTLFTSLLRNHPEIGPAVNQGALDGNLLRVLINNQPLSTSRLEEFWLKDGDTVSLLLRQDPPVTSS